MRHLAITVVGVMLTALLGCGDRKSNETGGVSDTSMTVTTPPASDAPIEARDFAFEERQGYTESIRSQLADLDGQIEQLAAEAKSKGGAVSDRALERIRTARKAADRNLSRIATATADTWDKVKLDTNRSVETVAEAVEGAMPK